jgi:hypothetical protein
VNVTLSVGHLSMAIECNMNVMYKGSLYSERKIRGSSPRTNVLSLQMTGERYCKTLT